MNAELSRDKEIKQVLLKCLEYGATKKRSNFYIPSNLTMHLTNDLSPAFWEAIYTHETIHSLLTDSWLGWTIQALDDLSNNLFVAVKRGIEDQSAIISWLMNIEYKKRRLCATWLQTQEGMALFFQLNYVDLEERALTLAERLCKIRGQIFKEEERKRIVEDVKQEKQRMLQLLESKKCKQYYWRGYEKTVEIANKFGKEFVVPAAMVACSVKLQPDFIGKNPLDFEKMTKDWKYNADKRLGIISEIPSDKPSNADKKNQLSFLKFLFKHLNEKMDIEVEIYDYVEKLLLYPSLPKNFLNKFMPAYMEQKERADSRWKRLNEKGYSHSQVISLINVLGEPVPIVDFEPISTPETEEILEVSYKNVLIGLEKCSFINEVVSELDRRKKVEPWMLDIVGFGELAELREILPESILVSKGKICPRMWKQSSHARLQMR